MEQLNQYVYERQELLAYLQTQPETLQESAEVLIPHSPWVSHSGSAYT